jgi:hypothetical protein
MDVNDLLVGFQKCADYLQFIIMLDVASLVQYIPSQG